MLSPPLIYILSIIKVKLYFLRKLTIANRLYREEKTTAPIIKYAHHFILLSFKHSPCTKPSPFGGVEGGQTFTSMLYPENFEDKIDFKQIRTRLKARCGSELGEELVDQMYFMTDIKLLQRVLSLTDEFARLVREEGLPFGSLSDLRTRLKQLTVEGTYWEAAEYQGLFHSLQSLERIIAFFTHKEDEDFPTSKRFLQNAPATDHITQPISHVLDKTGEIKDNATPELQQIRQKLRRMHSTISRKMDAVLKREKANGLIDADAIPTLREGRLVIPISSDNKRQLPGIIHDTSASGKTAFIEPTAVVEANNELRDLEQQERREIIKILISLADNIRPYLEDIEDAYHYLAMIDFTYAKAKLATEMQAIKPDMQDEALVEWRNAIHPLLYFQFKKEKRKVVPLNIYFNNKKHIVLISGPNAGGKSVCLKTVGLLQYMLQCGLLIPVEEGSKTGIFKKMFIDIGDDQSMENDLSTYSSHLLNMKFFIKNADQDTLVLIDEFGTGTEPQIGGAIAESILSQLHKQQTKGVITTHYNNIKHFAEEAKGISNAAMLYDQHHMQPLFTLQIGRPGSSFAIEIARKTGLPEYIIEEAGHKVGEELLNFDKHLREIARDKRYWEQKRDNIRKQNNKLERLSEEYESAMAEVKQEKKRIIAEAKKEADDLIRSANAQIEKTIQQIKESQADKEKTKQARQSLEATRQSINELKEQQNINKKHEKLNKKIPNKKKTVDNKQSATKSQQLTVGSKVQMESQGTFGEIMEMSNKEALVAFGSIQVRVKLNKLKAISNSQYKQQEKSRIKKSVSNVSEHIRQSSSTFNSEVDVRGMRGDEAIAAVTAFIDEATINRASRLRILHGTGHGILRSMIREYLTSRHSVVDFHDEQIQLGGSGITVVEMA